MEQKMIEAAQGILNWANSNQPLWAKQTLKPMPRVDERFVISRAISYDASVDVSRVVGTDHGCYLDDDWLNLLNYGKKMGNRQKDLADNPSYYLLKNINRSPVWCLTTFNGGNAWYVDGDANNRTCIAKFYLDRLIKEGLIQDAVVHGIYAKDIEVDWDLYRAVNYVQSNYVHFFIQVDSDRVKREDSNEWHKDFYKISVTITNHKTRQSTKVQTAYELLEWVERQNTPWFFSFKTLKQFIGGVRK